LRRGEKAGGVTLATLRARSRGYNGSKGTGPFLFQGKLKTGHYAG
jgi:hypothetical protein